MTTRITTKRARTIGAALLGLVLALPVASAQAQNAVITGKVTSEFGQPVDQANVYINDLSISVGTNAEETKVSGNIQMKPADCAASTLLTDIPISAEIHENA